MKTLRSYRRLARPLVLAAALLAAALAVSPRAVAGHHDHDDHIEARALLQRGEILPLSRILPIAQQRVPGDVIEVENVQSADMDVFATLDNLIAALDAPSAGTVTFDGRPLARVKRNRITRAGIARTFQNIRLFKDMSVVENLLVAQHMWVNRNLLAGVLNTKAYRQAESDALDHAFYWLEVVDLVDCANRLAGELSYGQQRRLEIARAMCTRPELICLDEPAAGLNPAETHALSNIVRYLRDHHGITVLLIEHDMGMVMNISDHIIVLDHGDVIARGNPEQIRHDEKVIAAYLGVDDEETAVEVLERLS